MPLLPRALRSGRSALVVLDLEGAIERLKKLEDCRRISTSSRVTPTPLTRIWSRPTSWGRRAGAHQQASGALSRYPELPLFGRAAREKRIEQLELERGKPGRGLRQAAFEQQKFHRLYGHFRDFIGQHLDIAFRPDPGSRSAGQNSTSSVSCKKP